MAGIFGAKDRRSRLRWLLPRLLRTDKKEQRGFNSEKYVRRRNERTQLAEKNIHLQIAIQKAKGKRERVSYRPS